MADRIATYTFIDKDNYDKAKDKIYYDLSSSSYETEYSHGTGLWILHILSDCPDPARAAQICSAYLGKPY